MLKKVTAVMVAGAFAASLSSASFAQGKKKEKAAAPTCSVCNMAYAAKKGDKTPVAVKVGKKTYYCCSGCDMSSWKKDKKGVLIQPSAPKK